MGRRVATTLAVGFLLVLGGCSLLGEEGSGVLVTRDLVLSGEVDEIVVGHAFEAAVTVGGTGAPAASVTIDDNLTDLLRFEQDERTLRVELDGRVRNATLQVRIALPSLVAVQASDAATVTVEGPVVGERIRVEASDASVVEIAELDVDDLEIRASGASRVECAGRADEIDAEASGASDLPLGGLAASRARIDVSGASSAEVDVEDELIASASGASTVRYHGTPDTSVESSGASTVAPI
ncbi:MAG TPA: DUF2807 domain-containing protein [Actinomycetota bacterium]